MEEIKENTTKETLSNLLGLFKKYQHILPYLALVAIIIYSGIYIRTLNIPGLKDVTTGTWTLAPDLDPYLFLRWAKEIVANGSIPANDTMRYVPNGFNTIYELTLPSYLIAGLYKFLHFFSPNVNVEYAAILYPVIFFCLFLIFYFLFVKKVFSSYPNSGWAAVVATAIVSVIPGLLHRTVAGVPEKESAGIFFIFLALYFIAFVFKEEKRWKAALFGILAGISTGLLGLIWGGVQFLLMIIPFSLFMMFFFSDVKTKDIIAYACWIIGFTVLMTIFTTRYGLGIFSPILGGVACFVLFLILFGKLFKNKIIALGILIFVVFIALIILNPGGHGIFDFLYNNMLHYILSPFTNDRITMSVAENSLAYLINWFNDFGIYIFWLFMIGSIFIAYETFGRLGFSGKMAAFSFFMFIAGMIISRWNADSRNSIIFIGGIILFAVSMLIASLKKEKEVYLDKNLLLIIAIISFSVFCSRSAIRLLYFVYPIVPIIVAFLFIRFFDHFKSNNEIERYFFIGAAIVVTALLVMTLISYNNGSIYQAKSSTANSYYTVQWQQAMGWVRDNTSKDAVFAHWWDYGYWIQSIGERATVLDGGNSIPYWDYLMGRLVLTGDSDNYTSGLEFLKTHKATYFLIDSSDVGKYPAYSNIGSNETYDRMTAMPTFVIDETQTQEKRNEIVYLFRGGFSLEEDLKWGGYIYPARATGIIAFLLPIATTTEDNYSIGEIRQPNAVLNSARGQIAVPIKCLYINNTKIEFEKGIEGCFYAMPAITENGIINYGAGIWLSPRLMKSLMVHLYLLNENKEGFVLVHSQGNPITEELNQRYNLDIPEISFHQQVGLMGPIKIWELNYSSQNIQENPAYLNTSYPNAALWEIDETLIYEQSGKHK